MKDRRQELLEIVVASERLRNTDPAHYHGTDGQHHQGPEHDPWTFVHVTAVSVLSMSVIGPVGRFTAFPKEGHEPKAEHVERSHSGRNPADQPKDPASVGFVGKRLPQNL